MFVFNVMLGKVGYYGELPAASDSLILVPFQFSSTIDEDLLAVATLDDLVGLLTESSIGRLTATSATVVDGLAALENDGWLAPAASAEVTRVVVCYQPDVASPDTDIIPMVSLDVSITPDGVEDFRVNLSPGYFQATGYLYA